MASIVDHVHRAAYRTAFVSARIVWRVLRPAHCGALIGIHVGSELLLVRQSYRREYSLPGGGLEAGEAASFAASRELDEELGLHVLPGALEPVHVETGLWDGRRDTVAFFALHLDTKPVLRLDQREIVETRFVTPLEAGVLPLTGPAACYLEIMTRTTRNAAPRPPP